MWYLLDQFWTIFNHCTLIWIKCMFSLKNRQILGKSGNSNINFTHNKPFFDVDMSAASVKYLISGVSFLHPMEL